LVSAVATTDMLVTAVRVLIGVVIGFGLLLAAITIHSFTPTLDPVAPVSLLDKISYWMGVHEKSAIVILDVGAWSTIVYTYIFHRHVSDGSFHIEKEYKNTILPGLFSDEVAADKTLLTRKIDDILSQAVKNLPNSVFRLRLRPQDCRSEECRPPIVVKVSNEALSLKKNRVSSVLQNLSRRLDTNSSFYFSPEKSFGALNHLADETALQWFAISLLSHSFINWKTGKSVILLNVREQDLFITTAVPLDQALPEHRVMSLRHLHAFGHKVKIATFKYPGLGLYSARSHVFGLSSTPSVFSKDASGTSGIDVRSACVNPVCDAFWHWNNTTFHVRGVVNGTYELVRERNGPFAGKKINRPVAKYDYCHRVCATYVDEKLRVKFEDADGGKSDKAIFDSLRGATGGVGQRKVFMAGLLREKCIERGLTLPDSGGNVKMRAFLDSLKHACKVPNTEQPFACLDLMFLATLVDQLLGFKQGSILHSSNNVNGMNADWPLAAAFYVYQNGL